MTPEEIMQQIQFLNKYSRFLHEKGQRETWGQTVARTVEYLKKQAPVLDDDTSNTIFMSIFNQEISPSMRLMATAGQAADANQLGVYNCSFLPLSCIKDFYDLTILLGHGVGVGFSVENRYVEQWEKVPVFTKNVYNVEIEDSIQGWAFSFLAQLSNALDGHRVSFDYSKIRPAGAPLMTRGGTASGYESLQTAHVAIQKILEARQGKALRSVDLFDIACYVAGAIVSGGVRRCLPSGSLVHTSGGMVPIENVEIGTEVLTSKGYHKVSNVFEQGKQKLVRVVTQDSSFACTPNHRVAVMDGDDSYVWKAASELRFGDKLIAPSIAVEGSRQKLPDFEYVRPKNSTTCKDITIPELDAKMAWLLGLLHGDGFVGKKEVTIPIHEDYVEMGQRAAEQLRRFGVNVGVDENEHYFVLRVKSKQLATYFGSWLKQAKTPISIPDFVWSASQDIKLAYVAGVMDADGSAKNRPIQVLVTVYEDFARQIQLLLSSCGVQARIKKLSEANLEEGWQKKYAVVLINSVAKEIFSEIPELFKSELKFDYNGERFTNKMPSGKVWSKSFSPLIPVNFVRLEDVEEEEETWDLEVEEVHEFFCEGYLVHNSAMIAIFDRSDADMMTSKSGEWYLDNLQRQYANISFVIDRRMTLEDWRGYVTMMDLNKSGEPGIWSRYAIKKHLPKRRTYVEEFGCNPCFLEGTIVQTVDGPKRIEDIIEPTFVYSMDENGRLVIRPATRSWKTRESAETLRIKISSGSELCVTPEHKIFVVGKGWVQAKDLQVGDVVSHFRRARRGVRYAGVRLSTQGDSEEVMEHRFVWDGVFGPLHKSLDVHHHDNDGYNNVLGNLSAMTHSAHSTLTRSSVPNDHQKWNESGRFAEGDGGYEKRIVPIPENKRVLLGNFGRKSGPYVMSVEVGPVGDVYDLNVEGTHCLIANNVVAHNCVEQILRPYELCNLSQIIARPDDTLETLTEKIRLATIVGTIQSSMVDFKNVNEKFRENCEDERLLGVSISGSMDCPLLASGDEKVLKHLKKVAIDTNREWAGILGINASVSVTCVKPDGNTSVLYNSAPGVHGRFAPFYIRRMRVQHGTPVANFALAQGIPAEPAFGETWDDCKTLVLSFPVKSPEGAFIQRERGAIEQLDSWLAFKKFYTETNPSVTINYRQEELGAIAQWLFDHQDYAIGLSFLPVDEHTYQQAPYEEISEVQYNELSKVFEDVDVEKFWEYENASQDTTETAANLACVGGACLI